VALVVKAIVFLYCYIFGKVGSPSAGWTIGGRRFDGVINEARPTLIYAFVLGKRLFAGEFKVPLFNWLIYWLNTVFCARVVWAIGFFLLAYERLL